MTPTDVIAVTDPETGEITNYTQAQYIQERDKRLLDWQNKQINLGKAKEAEMKARKDAVLFLHDPSRAGKTENIALGNGYSAKTKTPVNYGFVKNADGKIDKAAIEKALAKIEKDGEVGELVAERIIKWTPDLSLTEYNQLSAKHKTIIDAIIVTTEGTPTLEIVEPKTKK